MTQVRANGIEIECDVFGPTDGVPLLLVHGFGQQSIAWAPEFIEGFTRAGMRVISYDNRDTGFSRKFDGLIPDLAAVTAAMRDGRKPDVPYTLDDMAADAAGLLDALGIASAHVAGCSMGGMIAQLVALNHRDKVRSLVSIFSTTGDRGLPPSSREAHQALIAPPPGGDRETVIAHTLKGRLAYSSTGFALDERRAADFIGRAYDRMYYPEGALRHWSAILAAMPRGERLKSLDLPTLVLHGSADTLIPPEHGRRTAECIKGAEYHEIEGWGHDMPVGVVPILHQLMIPFIESVEKTRGR
jgi:pimeloyl-ACP methyl ester carboxylesterase